MHSAVLCHHKCASTWFLATTRSLATEVGQAMVIVNSSWRPFDEPTFVTTVRHANCIGDANASRTTVQALDRHASPYRAVHLVRDPRDILVSAYFSHLHSHPLTGWPELATHRKRLATLSHEDGLISELEFSRFTFDSLLGWETNDRILELKAEQATAEPTEMLATVARWLGWGVDESVFPRIAHEHDYERLAGRSRGIENKRHHYRVGVSGRDWVSHFTDRVQNAFDDRYGSLVAKLGYT